MNAPEKEVLLGYGSDHTKVAWSASKIKTNQKGFSDCRHKLLGDSFSCVSFSLFAVACCQRFLPQLTFQHLVNRLGLAPGFCAHIRSVAPMQRTWSYGSPSDSITGLNRDMERFNRLLLRRTNHTGSDVRVITGELVNSKAFPRESVVAPWWSWKHGFTNRWKSKSHINVLELESILLGIKFQIQRFGALDQRFFQVTDSYVCLSVVSKGRSGSKQLTRVLNKISAYLLGYGLQLVLAHVGSLENPSDEGSRSQGATINSRQVFESGEKKAT